MTDDIELLNDRKNSAELIYEIFASSEYNDGRFLIKDTSIIKIPKENIEEVFQIPGTPVAGIGKQQRQGQQGIYLDVADIHGQKQHTQS